METAHVAVRLGKDMSSVEDMCAALVAAFVEGRLENLPRHYVYPLAVFLPDGVRIEMTPDVTTEKIFARRAAAMREGMRDVRLRIADVREVPNGRVTVDLSWEFVDVNGQPIDRSTMRYFCRRDPDGSVRVEMIEFSEIAFADSVTADPPRPPRN